MYYRLNFNDYGYNKNSIVSVCFCDGMVLVIQDQAKHIFAEIKAWIVLNHITCHVFILFFRACHKTPLFL